MGRITEKNRKNRKKSSKRTGTSNSADFQPCGWAAAIKARGDINAELNALYAKGKITEDQRDLTVFDRKVFESVRHLLKKDYIGTVFAE